jgi:hypothetical protein
MLATAGDCSMIIKVGDRIRTRWINRAGNTFATVTDTINCGEWFAVAYENGDRGSFLGDSDAYVLLDRDASAGNTLEDTRSYLQAVTETGP